MSVITDVRVSVTNATGDRLDLTDHLLDVNVSDGLDASPTGAVSLPLRRTTSSGRQAWRDLIQLGDHLTVEMLAWDGNRGDWTTVLHGPITNLTRSEQASDGAYEARETITAAGMDHMLERDSIAWWMFYGTLSGYAMVRARLTPDELTQAPHRVAYDYLKKVALHHSVYDHNGPLEKHLQLDFGGLQSTLSNVLISLTAPEGNHKSAIAQYADSPIHELFTTTKPANLLTGDRKHTGSGPGEDKALTTLTWRAAPYPFATIDLQGDTSEWNTLPLHTVERTVRPVIGTSINQADTAVRNYFITYPAYQMLNEQFVYAFGASIVNEPSVRRFGFAPLKTRTHLINDQQHTKESIEEEMYRLTARLAGQWNHMEHMLTAQVSVALDPSIRPGERLRAHAPWNEDALHEFHIRGRSMTWNRQAGGRMTLALERGLPVSLYSDPAYFASGLKKVRVGGEVYADTFRRHDNPGEYWLEE